jgi:hypothetical protein
MLALTYGGAATCSMRVAQAGVESAEDSEAHHLLWRSCKFKTGYIKAMDIGRIKGW